MATLARQTGLEELGLTDYAASLQRLKAQHRVLSAQRAQLAESAKLQRDRVSDLEAHVDFLHHNLGPLESPSAAAAERSTSDELPAAFWPESEQKALPSNQTPVVDYESAIVAARSWHAVARQLMCELRELKQLVRIDALTGLQNRQSIDERLPREVASAERTAIPFALLMIDIDHFKRLNDTHGHPVGDAVLRSVASCISGCTRPSDLVARYGGEEFIVMLSGIHGAEAMVVAERIRHQIELTKHCQQPVTVSLGLADYIPHQGRSAQELVAEVDRALYLTKQRGRNRVQQAGASSLRPADSVGAADPESAPR